jgi:hypothetical protein
MLFYFYFMCIVIFFRYSCLNEEAGEELAGLDCACALRENGKKFKNRVYAVV